MKKKLFIVSLAFYSLGIVTGANANVTRSTVLEKMDSFVLPQYVAVVSGNIINQSNEFKITTTNPNFPSSISMHDAAPYQIPTQEGATEVIYTSMAGQGCYFKFVINAGVLDLYAAALDAGSICADQGPQLLTVLPY
jgi:hypothetical protein